MFCHLDSLIMNINSKNCRDALIAILLMSQISGLAVDYSDPTVDYHEVPMGGGSGDAWGTFVGNGAWAPTEWTAVKASLSAKIKTKADESNPNCFVAYIENPPTLSFTGHVNLPKVNTETTFPTGYWIYQDFVDAIAVHEYWHVDIHKAYAYGAWAAFESWLSTYQSAPCSTAAKASSNASTDLSSAISKIEATQQTFRSKKNIGHPPASDVTYQAPDSNHPKKYVKCNNPNWGQAAYSAVSAITVTFAAPVAGDCSCPAP